jgi:hypothetical protein
MFLSFIHQEQTALETQEYYIKHLPLGYKQRPWEVALYFVCKESIAKVQL